MGRASLLQILRERIQTASGTSPSSPAHPASRKYLTNLCVDAAKATIQLVLVLKQHNLLCRFSFTDHQPTTAALIILVLDSILQECVDTNNIIQDGVEMLRFMAHGGCRGAKSDLQTVEQLSVFAVALRKKISRGDSSIATGNSQESASNNSSDVYQSWVKWMSEKEESDAISTSQKVTTTDIPSGAGSSTYALESASFNSTSNDMDNSHIPSDFDLSFLDRDMGFGDVTNFGFEWNNGRMDMLDVSQLLAVHVYPTDGAP